MKCNIKAVFCGALTAVLFLSACEKDTDTPADKQRGAYLHQELKARGAETIICGEQSITLPASSARETLDTYIVRLHNANVGSALSRMSIADLQSTYRSCIRSKIIERFQ
jgi:hypothetical protein